MSRLAAVVGLGLLILAPACRISLEPEGQPLPDSGMLSASCMEAQTASDLAFIEDKIFKQSCIFSGCHNGAATDAGRVDLRVGMSHASLVNFDSALETGRKLVVAGQPTQSYLLMMLKHLAPEEMTPPVPPPPDTIGFMPQNAGGASLCTPKREAIQRWVEAGALNN